jgi:acyl-CoA reductase-like NAD-dependent aldehyde dehydrogenase
MSKPAPSAPPLKRFLQFIDGAFVESDSGGWHPCIYPGTAQAWAEIPRGNARDAVAAVAAAKRAFADPAWSKLTAAQRGRLLHALADLTAANVATLAELETRDNGKRYSESAGAIGLVPSWLRYFAGLADKVGGSVIPVDKPNVLNFTRSEPLGVVAAIIPWNSPLWLLAWKLGPALAAGNTTVIKPSEYASTSTLEFARLVEQAGFPKGVVNVVTGVGPEVGQALVDHPDVAMVSFTGSEAVGRRVAEAAGAKLKRVVLELGGKSPQIVFDDAPLEEAVSGVMLGIFTSNGQSCVAGSRLLLQSSVYDRFMAAFLEKAGGKSFGDPMDQATEVAPLANEPQFRKALDYIRIAEGEGAHRVLGGGVASDRPGYFVQPTVFTDVTASMRIAQEEVFGPVLSVIRFETESEAIELANSTSYGLAAGVWTQDLRRALRVSEQVKAGTVWVNTYRGFDPGSPAGGYKSSGIGRENGHDALNDYLQTKSVWISTGQ